MVDFGQPEAMEYKYPFHLVQHLLLHWLYTLYLTKFYLGEKCWKHERPDPSLWQSDKLLQFGLLAAARDKQVNRNIMHAVCMVSVRRLHLYISCVGSPKQCFIYRRVQMLLVVKQVCCQLYCTVPCVPKTDDLHRHLCDLSLGKQDLENAR